MNYITSYCKISDYAIYNKSDCLLRDKENNLTSFLDKCYAALRLSYPKYFKMDVLSKLGILGSEIVLGQAGNQYKNYQIAVILSNAHSSLDTDFKYHQSLVTIPSPSLFVYTLPNIVIGEICIRHQLKGDNEFFVFDKFNPSFMVSYASQVLNESPTEACLMGWIDVLHEHHDVFLYLVEKVKTTYSVEQKLSTLIDLYNNNGT